MPRILPRFVTRNWHFALFCGAAVASTIAVWYLVDRIVLSPFVELNANDGSIHWYPLTRVSFEVFLPVFVGGALLAAAIGRVYPALYHPAALTTAGESAILPDKLICHACGHVILQDGSAAGAKIRCPQCHSPVRFPGQRVSSEVNESDYQFALIGHHPIQGEGRVLGYPFFFRAKYDFWDFTVVTSHECLAQASHCEAPEVAHGYFVVVDEDEPEGEVEWQGYWLDGRSGSGTNAGGMHHDTAVDIIESCLARFIADERSSAPETPTVTIV